MEPHICNEENAEKFHDWLLHRGGLFIWRSVNLSNPGSSWTSPATEKDGVTPYMKPNWQCDSKPERHIKSVDDVVVATPKEVKRFHVATRMASGGMSFKVTDGGTRKIRAEVAKAIEQYGKPAYYEFDYEAHDNCVICVDDKTVPLADWVKERDQKLAS